MDFTEAAKQIVHETCHKAQGGGLDAADRAEAELAAASALSEAVGKSGAQIAAISRDLYWKLNPFGTVPTSVYEDSNFERLTSRIKSITAHAPQAAPTPAVVPVFLDAEETGSIDELFQDTRTRIGSGDIAARPADAALGSIQQVLLDFVGDLAHLFTIKSEWHGREAEAVSGPTKMAAEKILNIWGSGHRAQVSEDEETADFVPQGWSVDVSRALFDRLHNEDIVIMWPSRDSRENAIHAAAAKIRARIGRIVLIDGGIVRSVFDKPVTIDQPSDWGREVGSDVYRMLLNDDFKSYAVDIGAAARESAIEYLAKTIFEEIVPAVAFKALSHPQPATAPSEPPAEGSKAGREPWKMPWSVARKIIDELCSKSGNEAAFLSSFSDWLGVPATDTDGIKNELVSEIVVRAKPEGGNDAEISGPAVSFVYENYEGKIAVRNAVPVRMTYGKNKWHKERQWLMEAFDLGHGAMRTFAVKGIIKFL